MYDLSENVTQIDVTQFFKTNSELNSCKNESFTWIKFDGGRKIY